MEIVWPENWLTSKLAECLEAGFYIDHYVGDGEHLTLTVKRDELKIPYSAFESLKISDRERRYLRHAWETRSLFKKIGGIRFEMVDSETVLLKAYPTAVCHKCGYTWYYRGKIGRGTCPRCGNKVQDMRF